MVLAWFCIWVLCWDLFPGWVGTHPSASSPALPVPGSCRQTGRGILCMRAILPMVQNIPPKGWYQEWFSVFPPVRVCGRALLSSWQWSGFSGQRRWIQTWLRAHFTHFPPAGSSAIVPPNPKQCRVHSKHERRRGRASQVPNTPQLSLLSWESCSPGSWWKQALR